MVTDRLVPSRCIFCGDHHTIAEYCTSPFPPPPETKTVKSDGSSTDYYKLPPGATDLLDLIEHKEMDFAIGNIFKACYRLGEKHGTDLIYDLNKIIFFAERKKALLSSKS